MSLRRGLWAVLLLPVLLSACGGGGGDSGPSVTVSPQSITVSGSTEEYFSPVATVEIRMSGVKPDETVYVGYQINGTAILYVNLYSTGDNTGAAELSMRSPAEIGEGTHTDRLTLHFCEDEACNRQFKGSPATVDVTYTVTRAPDPPTAISLPSDTVTATAQINQGPPSVAMPVTITDPPASDSLAFSFSGGQTFYSANYSYYNGTAELSFNFYYGLAEGTYTDTVTLNVCFDYACTRHVEGSPREITVTYTVTPIQPPEPDRPVLPTASVNALPHNVVDAAYSSGLDAVVMIATYPNNALYVYDVATGTEKSMALDKPPLALSVSPDGLTAAVGHDALITHVALQQISTPASAKTLLNVSAEAGEVVLDGRGWVHAIAVGSSTIHSVEVAKNAETLNTSYYFSGTSRAAMHPTAPAFYFADDSYLVRHDVTNGAAVQGSFYSSYQNYLCSNLWLSAAGAYIYTACGNVFRTPDASTQTLLYGGSLALSTGEYGSSYRIAGVAESAQKGLIGLVEYDAYCESSEPVLCRGYYNLYDIQFFNRQASYSIPPMTVGGMAYAQRGLYSFYSKDGQKAVMLSRLVAMQDPAKEFYLSVLQ